MFDELGFPSALHVHGRASIADRFPPHERCGIYILHFANGEFYAGQAVDVTRRYVQHRQTHADIEQLTFKPVAREQLNDEERRIIWFLEERGYLLRNITFTSLPKGESDFDLIMSPEGQEWWLRDVTFVDDAGDRMVDPELRRKFRRYYERFIRTADANDVVEALRAYVRTGIPAIRRGEVSFWACSCMPKRNVYTRINVYWQEVLTAFSYDNTLWFSLHLARSPLEQAFGASLRALLRRHPTAEHTNHRYDPGGPDQTSFEMPVTALKVFITDPQVVPAIRLLNLRLMRKGPCTYGRYHCLDLADKIIQ